MPDPSEIWQISYVESAAAKGEFGELLDNRIVLHGLEGMIAKRCAAPYEGHGITKYLLRTKLKDTLENGPVRILSMSGGHKVKIHS